MLVFHSGSGHDLGDADRGLIIVQQNWSAKWKTLVIFNQFVFVFVSILTPLAIAPMTQIFEAEFQKSLSEVNLLVCLHTFFPGGTVFLES